MYIFNFHHVEPIARHADRKHITITPEGLRRFIRTIRQLGMNPISLCQVLEQGGPDPRSPLDVVLTFDDGYENFFKFATPILEAEKCPATVFVLPGKFEGNNDWDQPHLPVSVRDRLLSLSQMKELSQSAYITFGSHGMYHRRFSDLSEQALQWEIEESYDILSAELGPKFIPVLAYPWGGTSAKVVQQMQKCALYRYAFTTEKGPWVPDSPRYEIPRYSIFYRDGSPFILLAKFCRNGLPFVPQFNEKLPPLLFL